MATAAVDTERVRAEVAAAVARLYRITNNGRGPLWGFFTDCYNAMGRYHARGTGRKPKQDGLTFRNGRLCRV